VHNVEIHLVATAADGRPQRYIDVFCRADVSVCHQSDRLLQYCFSSSSPACVHSGHYPFCCFVHQNWYTQSATCTPISRPALFCYLQRPGDHGIRVRFNNSDLVGMFLDRHMNPVRMDIQYFTELGRVSAWNFTCKKSGDMLLHQLRNIESIHVCLRRRKASGSFSVISVA